jgi:TPR repeat protein
MTISFYPIQPVSLVIVCLTLFGCSLQLQKPNAIRVCDDLGCSDRPADYASFAPYSPRGELELKILQLESLARKDPRAAYDLGLRFFRGDGVRQDSYQSIKWMRNAAERGNLDAQKALGGFYLTGLEEMGADPSEGHKWLTLAASHGDIEAKKLLEDATIARKNEEAYSLWLTLWRPVFYRYWNATYPYSYNWYRHGWR